MPTAGHRVVTSVEDGLAAVTGYPTVIKADGLAAGKGVVIAADEAEARAALEEMLVARRFGDLPVVVEEFLAGRGALAAGALRRRARHPARARARLQADRRRRHRAEHRRHGLLLAGCRHRRPGARRDRDRPPAGRRGAGAPRHAVPRRPLRRADAGTGRRRRCSSSTSASAIPRRRSCCRGCAPTCSRCCWRRPSRAGSPASSSSGTRARRSASCSRRAATRRARRRAT